MMPASAEVAECFVCRKQAEGESVEGGVIWVDDLIYAGHCHLLGQPDILLGWLIVEPRRHVAELGDLTQEEAAAVGVLTSRLAKALSVSEGAEHVCGVQAMRAVSQRIRSQLFEGQAI